MQKKHNCPYLYVDIFGHPFCKENSKKTNNCRYFVPSEEFKMMKEQIDFQKSLFQNEGTNLFKVPSTFRCTKYDKLSDPEGHLPENFRDIMDEKFVGVTINI